MQQNGTICTVHLQNKWHNWMRATWMEYNEIIKMKEMWDLSSFLKKWQKCKSKCNFWEWGVKVIGIIYYHYFKKVVKSFCLQVRIQAFGMIKSEAGTYSSRFMQKQTFKCHGLIWILTCRHGAWGRGFSQESTAAELCSAVQGPLQALGWIWQRYKCWTQNIYFLDPCSPEWKLQPCI